MKHNSDSSKNINSNRLIVVVGGAYGSEAKGKATQFLVDLHSASLCVRSGGINAGHTVGVPLRSNIAQDPTESLFITRTLPSGLAHPTCKLGLAAGAIIEPNLLEDEIERLSKLGLDISSRLVIDPRAFILERSLDKTREGGWAKMNGSTETGTGAAMVRKIERRDGSQVLTDPRFGKYLKSSISELAQNYLYNNNPDRGGGNSTVVLEGTQGFGLSLHHGNWPYVTSRDTTAMALLSECGIPGWPHPNPALVYTLDVCLVVRSFPIRVGGPSGWMKEEVTWDTIREQSGRTEPLTEMTSVTKRTRRVGMFDDHLFIRAVQANHPTMIALHGADYIDVKATGIRTFDQLPGKVIDFVAKLERLSMGVPVRMVFTGTGSKDMCWRGE